MIVACGENLIDMIQRGSGYRPVVGGSALNVAMAVGRLGQPAGYAMPVSSDRLGQTIVAALAGSGVAYLPKARPRRPTGLALVSVGAGGSPEYAFYRHDCADVGVRAGELPRLGRAAALVHVGGSACLGSDQGADKVVAWALRQQRPLALDPNVRPALIDDRRRFMRRCAQLLKRCTVCKISDEDAAYMYNLTEPRQIARRVLAAGAALAAVSLGARGSLLATQAAQCKVPALRAGQVKDTVGAGDCYLGGLLAQLRAAGMLEQDACRGATAAQLQAWGTFAAAAAALNCARSGCAPPAQRRVQSLLGALRRQKK